MGECKIQLFCFNGVTVWQTSNNQIDKERL